jgi:hypothetical protein
VTSRENKAKHWRINNLRGIRNFEASALSNCDSSRASRKIEKLQEVCSLLAVFLQSK